MTRDEKATAQINDLSKDLYLFLGNISTYVAYRLYQMGWRKIKV